MTKDNKKEYPYLEHNLNKIAQNLKFINWNLGRILGHLKDNPDLIKKINKEIKEKKENKNEK